ncbi:MAG: FAD-dependent oxidoreductase, partial [Cyclobacteriaceae bacterium]
MSRKIDYIIVGFGLAGACLAIQLLRRGKKILVYDLPGHNRASSVAAGLFNPITGKRIVKTWKADEIFSYLHKFYRELETELGSNFFYSSPLYTPFKSVEEQNEWMSKSADTSFSKYISNIFVKSTFSREVNDPLGGILLSQCGHVNTNLFLEAVRKYLIANESYREELWNEGDLSESDYDIQYKDAAAQKVIYCTGIHALKSRFFKDVPLKALKGEVITIK